MIAAPLRVTSHVARDLLQSSALFQYEHQVIWEYVSNGLEYVDPGVRPVVHVAIDQKAGRITIKDNARGMSKDDLARYFQMHSENIDRKKGKIGRGMFGTGKSAAFGIARCLTLTTIRDGLRCKVRLARKDIEAAEEGQPIPIQVLEDSVKTAESNGSFIEIDDIHLKKMDVGTVIRFIERHIAHMPNATVFVNHQECKVDEPPYGTKKEFNTKDTPFESILGEIVLTLKVAKAPLEHEWQGVAILSNEVWHTTTLVGCEGKLFANYVFGEIDVPRLAQDKSPTPPFDMSRNMRLNPKNETVAAIYSFIGPRIEALRLELENADKERRRERDARRLQEEADAIAKIINKDFDDWRSRVQKTIARTPGGADYMPNGKLTAEEGENLIAGTDVPSILVDPYNGLPEEGNRGQQSQTPLPRVNLQEDKENPETKGSRGKNSSRSSSGGFRVDFLKMGPESPRAKYERDERTIYVNLDHPQIAAALALGGVTEIAFRRLSYEVAFSEYAIALASELAGGDWYHDITDPIVDIRDTLNRISRSAAALYAMT